MEFKESYSHYKHKYKEMESNECRTPSPIVQTMNHQ